MSCDKLKTIRQCIAQSKAEEQSKNALRSYISDRRPGMHESIALPKEKNESELINFAIRYIEHAPAFIEAIESCTREANIYEQTQGLLNITSNFFIQPPKLIAKHQGLLALIYQAYLAHRLMEEINDRLIVATGAPLTPMDMTMSNLVIHDLIGDDFANQLDMIVLYTIERSFQSEQLAQLAQHKNNDQYSQEQWEAALKKWPCLSGDNVISATPADADQDIDSNLH